MIFLSEIPLKRTSRAWYGHTFSNKGSRQITRYLYLTSSMIFGQSRDRNLLNQEVAKQADDLTAYIISNFHWKGPEKNAPTRAQIMLNTREIEFDSWTLTQLIFLFEYLKIL